MTVRTKPSVEAGMVHRWNSYDLNDDKVIEIVIYEPGNGTRYEIAMTRLPTPSSRMLGCSEEVPSYIFSWLNDVNKCMIASGDGSLHPNYVAEKMHIKSIADATVLAELFSYLLGFPPLNECHHLRSEKDGKWVCKICGQVEEQP